MQHRCNKVKKTKYAEDIKKSGIDIKKSDRQYNSAKYNSIIYPISVISFSLSVKSLSILF